MSDKHINFQMVIAEARMAWKDLQDYFVLLDEQYPDSCRQLKKYFDELVIAGFTEAQALEIVKGGYIPKA